MSYEGREEHLCKNGHRWEIPCHYVFAEAPADLCPVCSEPSVWYNAIDDTNCDAVGTIPDEEWAKLLITPERRETCNLGHSHIMEHAQYRQPTQEELEGMRHCWDGVQLKFVRLPPPPVFIHDEGPEPED